MPTLETAAPVLVEQTRVLHASRARVYEAWTNPEVLKQWFGPANMVCPNASLDVRLGGLYSIEVRGTLDPVLASRPNEVNTYSSVTTGVYTRVVPDELLEFTWTPSFNPGEDSLVTIAFKDVDAGTEIAVRHERFAPERLPNYTAGWTAALQKLAENTERA